MASKVRLFVDHPLGEGQTVPLSRDQANYLVAVMRLPVGTVLSLINGKDGEWDAEVVEANKRAGVLKCLTQTAGLRPPPDVWLLFAPIKKDRTAFIVEKATELGAAKIIPVQTDRTQSTNRVKRDKLQAHAIEATEQSGGTFVPDVEDLQTLSGILENWPDDRHILFCDEAKLDDAHSLAALPDGPCAIVIGPEGGFTDAERAALNSHPQSHAVSLGPRILRADTAAVAALTLWQSEKGDW